MDHRIRDFVFDHRRPLAAGCAALAVLTALQSLRPEHDVAPLTVAARDLESGHVLTPDDLTSADVPPAAHPDHVLSADDAVGRRVAGPMREGEALTDRRVLAPRSLGGDVLSMVRVDDPAGLIGLQVGDVVDVVSTSGERPEVAVRAATVATLPQNEDGAAAVVGLTTSETDALALAAVAVDGGVRIVVTGS